MATVSAEVADTEPALREIGAEIMAGWLDAAQTCLCARGLGPDDARAVAHTLLAGLEGSFVAARVLRTREPFEATGRALAVWVGTLATTTPGPRATVPAPVTTGGRDG